MYKILIVEDEPAAARYLRSIVEQRCPDFLASAIAENGAEALDLVPNLQPDVVLTDVKMPVMDGIELVAALKERFPGLPAIIVSGYQEFEYARKALSTGVVDYLLKPVKPQRLQELLAKLSLTLASRREIATLTALRKIAGTAFSEKGEAPEATSLVEGAFRAALLRSGGLPSRFRRGAAEGIGRALFPALYEIPGRDSREVLFLGTVEAWPYQAFVLAVSAQAETHPGACRTLLFAKESFTHEDLGLGIRKLQGDLDRSIVPGEVRIHHGPPTICVDKGWDPVLADRLEFALREGTREALDSAVRGLADRWQAERTPLLVAESSLRTYLRHLVRSSASGASLSDLEYLLDQAASETEEYGYFKKAALELCAKAAGMSELEYQKQDTPVFFNDIRRWILEHYSERLSLDPVADRFRISPSYLSKLFRKYEDKSFGEFLTKTRIEAACRLLAELPAMPLKDVADRVGIRDPFYFSRLFKVKTGVSPSNFLPKDPPE